METTAADENTAEYGFDSAGSANSGWDETVTTFKTITVDGTVNDPGEWEAGDLLGAVDGTLFYLTWDQDRIYAAIVGGDAASDRYNLLIDVDPLDAGAANSGTTAAFCGASFQEDAKPDYALAHGGSGLLEMAAAADGGSWEPWVNTGSGAATDGVASVEFEILKSEIGLDSGDPLRLYLTVCDSGGEVAAAWPPENPVSAGGVVTQLMWVGLSGTGPNRSPRFDAAREGFQTLDAGSTGLLTFFDGYLELDVTTPGGAGCQIGVAVGANRLVTSRDGGARRLVTITPENCSGLDADLALRYEDGTVFQAPDELRGIPEADLALFRWVNGAWGEAGGVVNTVDNTVTLAGVSEFSDWTFGSTDRNADRHTAPVFFSPVVMAERLGSQRGRPAGGGGVGSALVAPPPEADPVMVCPPLRTEHSSDRTSAKNPSSVRFTQ